MIEIDRGGGESNCRPPRLSWDVSLNRFNNSFATKLCNPSRINSNLRNVSKRDMCSKCDLA